MEVGDLVTHKMVHEDQEKNRTLVVIGTDLAWPEDEREETLSVKVIDLGTGVVDEWYDWQLDVVASDLYHDMWWNIPVM
tara:strand:+ start:2951 stop:3187 length:237 start_codon:yes stop_codon:yes gene_type:complete